MRLLPRISRALPWWRHAALGLAFLTHAGLSAAQVPAQVPTDAEAPAQAQAEALADCPAAAPAQLPTLADRDAARDRGFLWRVQKSGRTSYLYGTLHVGKAAWVFPGPKVTQALRASHVIALELDMLDADIVRRMQLGLAAAPHHALPEPLMQRLLAQLASACLPVSLTETLSPEMLTNTLVLMSAKREGLTPDFGIDIAYAGIARGMKKPTTSLETPEDQLKLLHGNTPAQTREMVEAALTELEGPQLRAMLRRLADDWAESRLDDLSNYEQWCHCMDSPAERAMQKLVLDDRNAVMARKIDALHAGGKQVFVAVGSLHMIGAASLPRLLAKRGYQVERVSFAP